MKRNRALFGWVVLFMGLLCSAWGGATDVNSAVALRDALKNATESNGVVTLSGNISLSSTLRITGGTMVLNLNGYTIMYDHTGSSEAATAILVEGVGANVTIKNGTIEVRAAKGAKASGWFSPHGKKGNSAICVQLKNGVSSLMNTCLIAKPGEGGDPYSSSRGNKGDSGDAYTVDPDVDTMNEMIANGAYVVDASPDDYKSEGYPGISTTLFTTTISLVNYTVAYNLNGGTIKTPGTSSYTIETANFSLPTIEKFGYAFTTWKYKNVPVDVNNLPATNSREVSQSITFDADWQAVSYKITYDTNGGNSLDEGSYTIESETITLPVPVRDKHIFLGWYTNQNLSGQPITTIPKGSTGDKVFYAKWLRAYSISYELNGGTNVENPPSTFTKESETIVLPTPTRKGYSFGGWFADESLAGTAQTEIQKGSIEDRIYYAKWLIINYKLNYHSNGGDLPAIYPQTYTVEETVTLPMATRLHYTFIGWYKNESENQPFGATIPKGTIGDQTLYACWTPTEYTIMFDMQGGEKRNNIAYNLETDHLPLPTNGTKRGYTFIGWYKDAALTQPYGTHIEKGTSGNFTLYAKWTPTRYKIAYDCYHGTNPDDAPTSYTIEESVILPFPHRANFSFVGWFMNDDLTGEIQTSIPKGTAGDQTFYARWSEGNLLSFSQPESGTIRVMQNNQEVKSGTKIGAGTQLEIEANPIVPHYQLDKLVVNDKSYTSSPQTIAMPAEGGLTISATFVDPRPAVLPPNITTNPVNTDYIPSGESVTVTLEKEGECDSLLYSIDGSTPKLYTGAFLVSTITTATKEIQVQAIARKAGCKDGITTQNIIFRSGKITITFNLPKGITASNPEGGEVVEAVANGGTFEFKLVVDKNYFHTLDTLLVTANGEAIKADVFGVYTLNNQSSNVTVNVTGVSGVTHFVTLTQSVNGVISFTGDEDGTTSKEFNYGDQVSVIAKADENYKFQSWTDGETANPRVLTVETDITLQARFVKDSAGFSVILPEIEGVKVVPLSGYSTEVKPGGKFKFFLTLDNDFNESLPVVYANNEKLEVNQKVYSLYNISENIRIAVDSIIRNKIKLTVQDHVSAIDMETGLDATKVSLYPDAMVLVQANAPEGEIFSKWNDGKVDNPRIATAENVPQMIPLFLSGNIENTIKIKLPTLAGAGVGSVNANVDVVDKGESIQLKMVVLPAYSQSEIKVTANGKELEASLSVRASTETKTLFYTLSNVTEDITIDVSGLKLNEYVVSLQQQEGGTVSANQIGLLKHGTVITLTATPEKGNMFLKWNNGNTLNPYKYVVTGDYALSGQFIASNMPVGNEEICVSDIRIYCVDNTLYLETLESSELYIWNLKGQVVKRGIAPQGSSAYQLPRGTYIIQVGNRKPIQRSVR